MNIHHQSGNILTSPFSAISKAVTHIIDILKVKHDIQQVELKANQFFTTVSNILDTEIKRIHVDDPGREQIVQDFIGTEVYCMYKVLEHIVLDKRLTLYNKDELNTLLLEIPYGIKSMTKKYQKNHGIPDIFVERFNTWYGYQFDTNIQNIYNFCNSKYDYSNVRKVDNILTLLQGSLVSLIPHVEETMKYLNGELDGVPYKGLVCESPEGHKNYFIKRGK